MFSSKIYDIKSSGLSKRPSVAPQAYSSDFSYLVFSNTLFAYSPATAAYNTLAALDAYSTYKLVNYANQLVIWGSSATSSAGKYNLTQSIYAVLYK